MAPPFPDPMPASLTNPSGIPPWCRSPHPRADSGSPPTQRGLLSWRRCFQDCPGAAAQSTRNRSRRRAGNWEVCPLRRSQTSSREQLPRPTVHGRPRLPLTAAGCAHPAFSFRGHTGKVSREQGTSGFPISHETCPPIWCCPHRSVTSGRGDHGLPASLAQERPSLVVHKVSHFKIRSPPRKQ